MAEEQESFLPLKVQEILPTQSFSLLCWKFVPQYGASRPGVEMHILMKPLSGGSIRIKVAFWGNGSPRKAIYVNSTSVAEVKLTYPGGDPWEFIRRLREGAVALRR